MPNTTLNIPILVQTTLIDDQQHYHLRPLFFNHPVATHRRYEQAIALFRKELKHYFRGYVMNRENAHHLLWYMFNPKLSYKTYPFSFTVNKQPVSGRFGVASFKMQGKTFLCFPALYNFMCMIDPDTKQKKGITEEAQHLIEELLKKYKKEDGNEFEPAAFFADRREFVITIEQTVNIGFDKFKFEKEDNNWFFSRFSNQQSFDGSIEIERVGYDLNSKYPSELKRAYYQEKLVKQLSNILFHQENTPVVLLGREGVGRHTVVEEVVWRYQQGFTKKSDGALQKVWHLNPNRVIAGMSIVGMWEKRFEAILKFIKGDKTKVQHKMLIDNPVALLRIGKSASNSLTLSNVLKPYLEKRQLQLILIATPEEWKIIQEQDRSFSDLFQIVRMNEPDFPKAVKIVLQGRKDLELEHDCKVNIQAINQLFTIHRNYLKNKALPGSVLKMLTQLATKYRLQDVDAPEVRQEFKIFSGLRESIFDEGTRFEKGEVQAVIQQQLIGQPQAVEALTEVVHTIKAKLSNKNKPFASFLFIGPTGVGKTQAAKVLSQYLMGSQDQLMRFDMNEYIDESALQRLIGDYHNPEGLLTGKVRYQPFGILLFDEIEKAHPKIHDLLLQVLDDGRLTDSLGRTVDFSNTIIIMTSNVGAREVSNQLGFDTASRDDGAVYRKAVERQFRPEFINRIDRIVIFNSLDAKFILKIAHLQIKELLKRDGFVRRTTILNISQDALEWVAKRGFNARMGGRALKRQIERDLTALSAEQLISTYSENPIFFDILLENGQLAPKITSLEFVETIEEDWIPNLPSESQGRTFYNRLLRTVEYLERKIAHMDGDFGDRRSGYIAIGNQSGDQLDWQYFDFKNKVAEIKERLHTVRLGFRERYFKEGPAIPLRLKRGHLTPRRANKGMRENYKDRLFQQEALREISEAYQFAAAQFDSLKTEFIQNYLDVAFLQLFSIGFLKGKNDQITLEFQSCITGQGEAEIAFLIKLYANIFETLELQYEIEEAQNCIHAEGHSLHQMLQGEAGIHLFYIAHQNPLPIRLILKRDAHKPPIRPSVFQVIRIYDGMNTLTDLRTGFSNEINITASEFKLLLFAGIPAEIRKGLL